MARVLVLMSGGVDSSVAAYLLKSQGHEVVGLTLKLFELKTEGPGCCGSPKDIYDAKECARLIGIAHYTLDESESFKRHVIDPFRQAYLKGETPNPCVECNRSMKFGQILDLARKWGFDAVATGHYARIGDRQEVIGESEINQKVLLKAKDGQKDQSYFLYMLKGDQLAHIMFPVGEMEKEEVREIANKAGLPTAQKPDSQEICFVGAAGGDYRKILGVSDSVGFIKEQKTDKVLGRHSGYFNFTLGQREGLGVAAGKPLYVTQIDPRTNTVCVGDDQDLMSSDVEVKETSWLWPQEASEIQAQVKIRHRSPASSALIYLLDNNCCRIVFDKPQRAPTPGQFAVFYDGDQVLGGGRIAYSVERGA